MTHKISISIPDYMMENIIGETDNKSQRIQELIQKGSMVETLEEATGRSFKELIKKPRTSSEAGSPPNDSGGSWTHTSGNPVRSQPQGSYKNGRTQLQAAHMY